MVAPRERLLDAAIDFVSGNGIADLSLRQLATEIGTSHRMLIHHFGSKEGLWVAIVQEVERRQLAVMAAMEPAPGTPYDEWMRAWWLHISDPKLWPNARLFFEIYGRLDRSVIDSWVEPAADLGRRMGVPKTRATSLARLGLAVTRGLLLDLLATGDRKAVDAAMEEWIALSGSGL